MMAAPSRRGHPGGDQGTVSIQAHMRLGTIQVLDLEEAGDVEQHKSEVRSGVIFWSLSLRRNREVCNQIMSKHIVHQSQARQCDANVRAASSW